MSVSLRRAVETIKEARLLTAGGFHGAAVSRAYYAVFYAAREALFVEGVRAKTHRGVASEFSRLFVATGRLDASAGHALRGLQEERAIADYQDGDTEPAQAERAIETAVSFVSDIASVLGADVKSDPPVWASFTPDQKRDLIAQLGREMEEASEALEFERAAELRDSIAQIEATLAA